MYKVVLHKNAIKFYKSADSTLQSRIENAITAITRNPQYNVHIKKLHGDLSSLYRYRMGDTRILYEIHEDISTIQIKSIDSRGSAYK